MSIAKLWFLVNDYAVETHHILPTHFHGDTFFSLAYFRSREPLFHDSIVAYKHVNIKTYKHV